jgi:hypothetical protein
MSDDVRDIAEFYNNNPAGEHSRLERHQLEHDLTWRYLDRYFAQVSEIAPLPEALGFETLVVAGIESAISADDESYNKLQGKQRQQWLDLFYEMSVEESIVGASRQLLYIGKKSDA